VLDQASALVKMPHSGGRFSTEIMPDPDAVQAARKAAGELLSRLTSASHGTGENNFSTR
jgi:hypothetical protein